MIQDHLDQLLVAGRLTGYTIEEDSAYLEARIPTLTYRMYVDGAASHQNLGAFAAAMAELGAVMRLSRVRGNLGECGAIRRSRQLCLTAEFGSKQALNVAVQTVHRRFIAAPAAAPGSWHYPDVRVVAAEPQAMAHAFAHCWKADSATAVALTLDSEPPIYGAQTVGVRVLCNWITFLQGKGRLAVSVR
jgi:hypothetical protein